jgi:hypothetical protein
MKNIFAVLSLTLLLANPQSASAANYDQGACTWGFALLATITSAPTGTLNIFWYCRDEVLALQQDAIQYKITGQASPLLQSTIQSVREKDSSVNPEDIVNKIIEAKLK